MSFPRTKLNVVREMARYMGYELDPSGRAPYEAVDLEELWESGVRQFYFASNYQWSFLTTDWTAATVAGTAEYDLPADFSEFSDGPIVIENTTYSYDLMILPRNDVEGFDAVYSTQSRPRLAYIDKVESVVGGVVTDGATLVVSPVPDRVYTLRGSYMVDPVDLGDADEILGGNAYSEVVLESCLAVCEQRRDGEAGIHTQNYARLLAAAIRRDGLNQPRSLGFMNSEYELGRHSDEWYLTEGRTPPVYY